MTGLPTQTASAPRARAFLEAKDVSPKFQPGPYLQGEEEEKRRKGGKESRVHNVGSCADPCCIWLVNGLLSIRCLSDDRCLTTIEEHGEFGTDSL